MGEALQPEGDLSSAQPGRACQRGPGPSLNLSVFCSALGLLAASAPPPPTPIGEGGADDGRISRDLLTVTLDQTGPEEPLASSRSNSPDLRWEVPSSDGCDSPDILCQEELSQPTDSVNTGTPCCGTRGVPLRQVARPLGHYAGARPPDSLPYDPSHPPPKPPSSAQPGPLTAGLCTHDHLSDFALRRDVLAMIIQYFDCPMPHTDAFADDRNSLLPYCWSKEDSAFSKNMGSGPAALVQPSFPPPPIYMGTCHPPWLAWPGSHT